MGCGKSPRPPFLIKGKTMAINITVADFRQAFPEFSDTTKYPDQFLQRFLTLAQVYISNVSHKRLKDDVRKLAIQYMAAHLMWFYETDGNGNIISIKDEGAGLQTSSHIGDVSVSMQVPQTNSEWEEWLNHSPYGRMLLALLGLHTSSIFYVGTPRAFGIR